MTTCRWIIENFSEGDDIFGLIQAVKDAGHSLTLITRRNGFEYKHIQFENECVVFYGSINMAKLVSEHLTTCYPVVWETDKFECIYYWPHYKNLLFNDKYEFIQLKTLKENKFEYYSKYGKDSIVFVRPSGGDKQFSGQLLDLQDFDKFFSGQSTLCNATEDSIIAISTPKNVVSEYRFIATDDKKIVSKSCYRFHGKITSVPGAPAAATEFINRIFDVGVFPARIFSIDVAEDSDGNFWLMEFNSFNSCGLYSTDKRAIVDAASKIAIEDYNLQNKK